jgi:N6-adenosine-specific RNA methylase IME4
MFHGVRKAVSETGVQMFRLILADPPWQHNDRKATRRDNSDQACKFGLGAAGNYDTMPTEEIAGLGPLVQAVAAPDAYLAIWVLESMPADGDLVVRHWSFETVCTLFAWVKTTASGAPFFGPGSYSGGNLERCLLARNNRHRFPCWHSNAKGSYKPAQIILEPHPVYPPGANFPAWHKRAGQPAGGKKIHSRKPATAYERLERWLDPHLNGYGKLELFATQRRHGWTSLGNALTGTDIRADLAELAGAM